MVIDHLPMVKAIAARFRLKLPLHLELNDLVQAGIVGLLEAAHRYDPGTENCFSTYATHRIKGAILDSLRGQDPASRKLRKAHRELEGVKSTLTQELHRTPTESELAERSGVPLSRLREIVLDVHILNRMNAREDFQHRDTVRGNRSPNEQPGSSFDEDTRARILKEIIAKLPESYRMIVTMHYGSDFTLKQVGGKAGIPERQVSRIHKRALQRMGAMLAAQGISSISEI